MIFINIALLITALIGSLTAIGGDTWDKSEIKLISRITKRGWIAILCLTLSFSFGCVKEITTVKQAKIDKELSIKQQQYLQQKLSAAEQKISQLKPELENAIELAMIGIPKEVDYPLYKPKLGTSEGIIMSAVTGEPLKVYAGHTLKYYIPGDTPENVELKIGDNYYPIIKNQGELIVFGAVGEEMGVKILHPSNIRYKYRPVGLKLFKMGILHFPVNTFKRIWL